MTGLTGTAVVLPIANGGDFARTAGFAASLMGTGTETTGVVRCDQIRILDVSARKSSKLERVSESVLDEVMARMLPIFE